MINPTCLDKKKKTKKKWGKDVKKARKSVSLGL